MHWSPPWVDFAIATKLVDDLYRKKHKISGIVKITPHYFGTGQAHFLHFYGALAFFFLCQKRARLSPVCFKPDWASKYVVYRKNGLACPNFAISPVGRTGLGDLICQDYATFSSGSSQLDPTSTTSLALNQTRSCCWNSSRTSLQFLTSGSISTST